MPTLWREWIYNLQVNEMQWDSLSGEQSAEIHNGWKTKLDVNPYTRNTGKKKKKLVYRV